MQIEKKEWLVISVVFLIVSVVLLLGSLWLSSYCFCDSIGPCAPPVGKGAICGDGGIDYSLAVIMNVIFAGLVIFCLIWFLKVLKSN